MMVLSTAEDLPRAEIGVSGACWVEYSHTGAPRYRRCPLGQRKARSHPCLYTDRLFPTAVCKQHLGFVQGSRARGRTGFALRRLGEKQSG